MTGVFLGAVMPVVQVEQRDGGSSSDGAQPEDGGERERYGGHDRGHDELGELGKMVEERTGVDLICFGGWNCARSE
uniref:DUF834 domain-containing protein n=1 Tax=Oryza punctata TaxID=4537 RepID=A0A0E0K1A0_ORYPU